MLVPESCSRLLPAVSGSVGGHKHVPVPGQLLLVTAHHTAVGVVLAWPSWVSPRPPPFYSVSPELGQGPPDPATPASAEKGQPWIPEKNGFHTHHAQKVLPSLVEAPLLSPQGSLHLRLKQMPELWGALWWLASPKSKEAVAQRSGRGFLGPGGPAAGAFSWRAHA